MVNYPQGHWRQCLAPCRHIPGTPLYGMKIDILRIFVFIQTVLYSPTGRRKHTPYFLFRLLPLLVREPKQIQISGWGRGNVAASVCKHCWFGCTYTEWNAMRVHGVTRCVCIPGICITADSRADAPVIPQMWPNVETAR